MSVMCRRMVVKDKSSKLKSDVSSNINKPKTIWKTTKDILYGRTFRQPERVIENNNIVNGSAQVANSFNRHFLKKISDIEINQPNNNIDPMNFFKKYIPKLDNTFSFKEVRMSTFRKELSKIKTPILQIYLVCIWT